MTGAMIAGAGYAAREYFVKALKEMNIPLLGIYNRTEKTGEKLAWEAGCRYFKDYNKMLTESGADLLIVAGATVVHLDFIRRAVEQGIKYIFCEKPAGLSLEEAMEIRRIAAGKEAYMPLLLEADPSEGMIAGYLDAGELYALMINGNTAAVAVVLRREDGAYELMNLAVDAQMRGKGYGSRLARHLCRVLSARANRLWVGTSPANVGFYERLGFRIVGDGADESEWLMTCRLDCATGLELRRLVPDEVPAFVELRVKQLIEEGARETVDLRPMLRDYYVRHLADDTFVSWLALKPDGSIVATSGISIVEKPPYFGCPTGKIALISSMFCDPEYRRQGIARDLLCRVLEEARVRGCGAVQITASEAGVPLYESVGFSENPRFRQLTLA